MHRNGNGSLENNNQQYAKQSPAESGYLKFIIKNSKGVRNYQYLILILSATSGILLIKFTLDLSSFLTILFAKTSLNSFILELLPLIIIFSALSILSIISSYITKIITYRTRSKLMEKAYNSVSSSSIDKIKSFLVGDLITRITGDTIQVSSTVATFLPGIFSSVVLFSFYFVAFWLLSHILSYVFLIFAPLFYFIFMIEKKMLPPLVHDERLALSLVTNSVNEYMLNIEGLKGLSASFSIKQEFKKTVDRFYSASKKMINSLIKYSGASAYLKTIMPFILLTIAFYFYTVNLVLIGPAIAFFFLSSQAYAPLSSVSGYLSSYADGISRYKRIGEVFDLIPESSGELSLVLLSGVEISNASIVSGETKLLEIGGLKIMPGEHIAVTGENGSGKSIFTRLFNKSIEFSGDVKINGIGIQSYSIDFLRRNIIRIGEESFIFADTVYNNISLYDSIQREDVKKAMELCEIDFVKVDEKITPATLSDGQKQRIQLARAICRKPGFLILDEALSGIDDRIEKAIIGNIIEELSTSIILLVSHRYSTLARMDRTLILKDGNLVCDIGDKERLLACPEWKELMKYQIIN